MDGGSREEEQHHREPLGALPTFSHTQISNLHRAAAFSPTLQHVNHIASVSAHPTSPQRSTNQKFQDPGALLSHREGTSNTAKLPPGKQPPQLLRGARKSHSNHFHPVPTPRPPHFSQFPTFRRIPELSIADPFQAASHSSFHTTALRNKPSLA